MTDLALRSVGQASQNKSESAADLEKLAVGKVLTVAAGAV
jgi:hypothetical protein